MPEVNVYLYSNKVLERTKFIYKNYLSNVNGSSPAT
jgi:hypothetical protein